MSQKTGASESSEREEEETEIRMWHSRLRRDKGELVPAFPGFEIGTSRKKDFGDVVRSEQVPG